MFNFEEHVRFQTSQPFDTVLDRVRQALETVGDTAMEREGDFDIHSRRFKAFAWETKVEGRVKQRGEKDDVSITVNYTFNPTPVGIILGVLFLPIGAVLFIMGMNAKQELQRNLRRALEDAEESLMDRR